MLLLDENFSPKLASRLDKDFPGIKHVLHVGLDIDEDIQIWKFAKREGWPSLRKTSYKQNVSKLQTS